MLFHLSTAQDFLICHSCHPRELYNRTQLSYGLNGGVTFLRLALRLLPHCKLFVVALLLLPPFSSSMMPFTGFGSIPSNLPTLATSLVFSFCRSPTCFCQISRSFFNTSNSSLASSRSLVSRAFSSLSASRFFRSSIFFASFSFFASSRATSFLYFSSCFLSSFSCFSSAFFNASLSLALWFSLSLISFSREEASFLSR